MKYILFCFAFVILLGESVYSQMAVNSASFGQGFRPGPFGGLELHPGWRYRNFREAIVFSDLEKWWKKHPKTLIKEDRKRFKKFILVEQGSFVFREHTDEDLAALKKEVHGTIGHYIVPHNSFTSGKVKATSKIATLLVATPEDLESVYYNMATKINVSKDTSFDMLIEYCTNYLSKFPNGNIEHRREVKERLEDIYKIPVEIRKSTIEQILADHKAQRIKKRESDEKNSEEFWKAAVKFLFPPGGGSGGKSGSGSCSACHGRGYAYSGDNRREPCYTCGGSGNN